MPQSAVLVCSLWTAPRVWLSSSMQPSGLSLVRFHLFTEYLLERPLITPMSVSGDSLFLFTFPCCFENALLNSRLMKFLVRSFPPFFFEKPILPAGFAGDLYAGGAAHKIGCCPIPGPRSDESFVLSFTLRRYPQCPLFNSRSRHPGDLGHLGGRPPPSRCFFSLLGVPHHSNFTPFPCLPAS